ncbi:hypothetical protein Slala02_68280 [Streptomyces lavendulae subsp. lavendulae]|nr:hypothetical protein Slala02_68280 [Streptomyces lavendulae subsp. lavendulae]
MAGDQGASGGGGGERGEDPHGGGLARAVGAQQSADGALRHGQVEPAQGVHLAVVLLQTLTKYSVRSRHAPHPTALRTVYVTKMGGAETNDEVM